MPAPKADPRLFVALDLPTVQEAQNMVEVLGDAVVSYKIGLQLLPLGGVALGQALAQQGKQIFYDFKFHDIGATVEKATRSIAGLSGAGGEAFLTVHARPDVMVAAVVGRGNSSLKILGVTVLTSLDAAALKDIGYRESARELVLRRVDQALKAGIDGVVASPLEVEAIRAHLPDNILDRFLIVTPGVRPSGASLGDQKRVATPAQALNAGASHLVVGRPITQASDPRRAAQDICAQMQKA